MSDGRDRDALAELVLPICAIAFTMYYMLSVREGPWEAKFSAYFVGSALIATSALFIGTRIWAIVRHRLPARLFAARTPRGVLVKRIVLLALTLGYITLIDRGGGFTLSNFVFLSCAILVLSGGGRPARAIGVAAGLSLAGYLLFIVAFDTRFPEGPFERAVESVLELR